jgi:hypothetical protein
MDYITKEIYLRFNQHIPLYIVLTRSGTVRIIKQYCSRTFKAFGSPTPILCLEYLGGLFFIIF